MAQILYRCGCSPFLNVIISLLGARGKDLAFTLNPFAGTRVSSTHVPRRALQSVSRAASAMDVCKALSLIHAVLTQDWAPDP